MCLVKLAINHQVTLDFFVRLQIVRDTVSLLDKMRKDNVPQHVGVQFFLVRVIANEDFHEKTVDHHGIETNKRLLFLHPF